MSWEELGRVGTLVGYSNLNSSVRAMQYKLDTTANTKIPDNLVHKLPFKCFRNQFQCLERQFQNLWYFYTTFGGIQVNHFDQLI